jgi:GNAT superfamily N-acetyltransferase
MVAVVAITGFEPLTLELKDGTKVHVRPIVPDDEPLLHEAVAAMSERTVYFRFFSPLKRMPDALAHRLAVVDYKDRFAIVATMRAIAAKGGYPPQSAGQAEPDPAHPPGGKERIVGVARYDRAPGTDVAETALAVVDEFQRRGLGRALLTILSKVAREHGIKTFSLIVLPENQHMLGLLRKMGWIHQAKLTGGVYEITFDLPE